MGFGFNKLREIGLMEYLLDMDFHWLKKVLICLLFSDFEIIKTQGYNLTYKLINYYKRLNN